MGEEIFETSGGALRLRPVSLEAVNWIKIGVERELRAQGLPLDPPTYEVTTVAGTIERHPHTEDTLETEQDREAWALYQDAVQTLNAAVGTRVTRYMLAEGVVLDGPDEAWVERMRQYGIPVSDDRLERREQYLTYEFARTPRELLQIIQRIMVLSAEGSAELQEAAEAMESFFRGEVETTTSEETATAGR